MGLVRPYPLDFASDMVPDSSGSIWHRAKKDPEQIWLDLCQPGPRQYEAVKLCKKFLRIYATARKRRAANLGLSEYAVRQSVRSATTLMGYWRALVSEFNQTVLAKKRKEDPHNKSQWSLKVMTGLNVFVKHGPIFEVTSVGLGLDAPLLGQMLSRASCSVDQRQSWRARTHA